LNAQFDLKCKKDIHQRCLKIITLMLGIGTGKTEASKYLFRILKKLSEELLFNGNKIGKVFNILIKLNGKFKDICENFYLHPPNINGFFFLCGVFEDDMYDFLCKFQEKNFISSFEFDYNNVMKEFYNI
jgi:hypothetical protein